MPFKRAHRVFGFDACRAAVAREPGDELRPVADETRVHEVEDRPEVAEAVLDRRSREREPGAGGDEPQLLRRVVGRVLDHLRFVEHDA